jgi:hypothetical protein
MQVEEVRNPSLRGKPLAVTQKYLVVTANYEARAAGVTKLMGLQDALKTCPHLATVSNVLCNRSISSSNMLSSILIRPRVVLEPTSELFQLWMQHYGKLLRCGLTHGPLIGVVCCAARRLLATSPRSVVLYAVPMWLPAP